MMRSKTLTSDDALKEAEWEVGAPITHRRIPQYRLRLMPKPEAIAEAALTLFLKRGYEQTRVETIARAAGISKGGVYLYFPSKQALLTAAIDHAVVRLETIFSAGCDAKGDNVLKTVLTGTINLMVDPITRDIMRLRQTEAEHKAPIMSSVHVVLAERFAGLAARVPAAMGLAEAEVEQAIGMLIGPLLLQCLSASPGLPPRAALEAIAEAQVRFWSSAR